MKKHIYTIPHGINFIDTLANYVIDTYAHDPIAFSQVKILLPNRRSSKQLTELMVKKLANRSFTLPKIKPLGDIQEDDLIYTEHVYLEKKPISPLEQQCILARLIKQWHTKKQKDGSATDHIMSLASQLAGWLGEFEKEQVAFTALHQLVPEQYAKHWQETLEFLNIITEHLPAIYQEKNVISPVAYRNFMMMSLAQSWQNSPPETPIIAAGSTGSIPVTRQLLNVISQLPHGKVILPGLDKLSDKKAWEAIDEYHPQYMMKQLLAHMDVRRDDVNTLVECNINADKAQFFTHMFKPAADTTKHSKLESIKSSVVSNLQYVECESQQEEARIIAMMIRWYIEEKDKKILVVTNNETLIRRITNILPLWNIEADFSSGKHIGDTAPGVFLRLIIELLQTQISPVALLALLKHPLAAAGIPNEECRKRIRKIELEALRGVRVATGFDPIIKKLSQDTHKNWLRETQEQLQPLSAAIEQKSTQTFKSFLEQHIAIAEWLATNSEEKGSKRLWSGDVGQQLATLIQDIKIHGEHLGEMRFEQYAAMITALLQQQTYRRSYSYHPRVSIVSSMESRLLSADVIILADVNEGSWPMTAQPDPWMNRDMKAKVGLPNSDRRIGQAAHDFYGLLFNPVVCITRAQKIDGSPTTESRWITRLNLALKRQQWTGVLASKHPWEEWARLLYKANKYEPIQPPAPKPPIEMRPRSLSVTQIEKLIRDPYVIYASKILGLKPLEKINQDPGALEFGNFVHDAIDLFMQKYDEKNDLEELMLQCGREALGELAEYPSAKRFWWPKFEQIAQWFINNEQEVRKNKKTMLSETWGEYTFTAPAGEFTLKGKTDRIEVDENGAATVIDYKTGMPPSNKDVQNGFSPQLPLEALIALYENEDEKYKAIKEIRALAYWQLKGGKEPVKLRYIKEEFIEDILTEAEDGLKHLIATFDDPETPYLARPDASKALKYNDYAHLARIQEWE